jgi:hypothetical protein
MEDIYLEHKDVPVEDAALTPVEEPASPDEVSRLGLTMSLPETGALRPTVILGVGGFGRRALQELRCRFLDRFGDMARVPLIRLLYVDVDPESVRAAVRGPRETAFGANEVCHLPLQPVGNYRRRMLEQLSDWLPREKLYALPRSLQTQGSRSLGRLAFADNHLRFLARLRREVQAVSHPDALFHSVNETGLALRDSRPRVVVLAAAGGGGSGFLVDLGYALRRLLQTLRYPQADVTAHVFCGAPEDPATPRAEQANVYATLTELNHFTDPAVPFTAQYSADGPRTVDHGPPFTHVYLVKLAHRGPEALRDALAHLGSYLFHELTTPLGLRLDHHRPASTPGATPFRSFGTYGVWFPRGLLLRQAARAACTRLLGEWQQTGAPTAQAEVEAACARAVADPELRFEAVCGRIQDAAAAAFDGNMSGALTSLLATLEEQSLQPVAQDDPGNWAQSALARVQEWVGTSQHGDADSGWRKSRLGRVLISAIQNLSEEWDQRLAEGAYKLMEHPGGRVAAADAALERLVRFCQETAAAEAVHLEKQVLRTRHAWGQLEQAVEQCYNGAGGFSLFGNRSRRLLRVFMDHLTAFSRQRLVEEVVAAGVQFFNFLGSRLANRLRDLAFCRQRLRHGQESLESMQDDGSAALTPGEPARDPDAPASAEAYWEMMRQSKTARLVLPDGEEDLERAARRFVDGLSADQWTGLDQALQDRVLAALGGLHRACLAGGDVDRLLTEPLVAAAAAFLGDHLPVTDVAEVEFSATAAQRADLPARIRNYFDQAAPLVPGKSTADQPALLLVSTSEAGREFGDEARRAVPEIELVRVPGQADLMFCREQGNLTSEELERTFRACRQAYHGTAVVPTTSPHARFDIQDWVPLDP